MAPDYDASVPALLVTVGPHELDYGALATVRTLGRVGIPVFATLEREGTPLAASRYLTGGLVRPTTGEESPTHLLERIRETCGLIGRPAVAIAGDDESAVLLARHRADLDDVLLLPEVSPDLPARLADKASLSQLCAELGVPAPITCSPRTHDEVSAFVASCPPPWIVKNPSPFGRLVDPAVARTAVAADRAELDVLIEGWTPGRDLLLQEYLPSRPGDDWYLETVIGDDDVPTVAFTGRKVRAYPETTGIGTASQAEPNEDLKAVALDLCRRIGYRGVADMDWRLDRRDGRLKLVDFNPRRGAQFRLFVTSDGVDVVRALHLTLTGRNVPDGPQVYGRRHVVGVLDHRARLVGGGRPVPPAPHGTEKGRTREGAWWASDDPTPAAVTMAQVGSMLTRSVFRSFAGRQRA